MESSGDGPPLAAEWQDAADNVCGVLRGGHPPYAAGRFARAGWRARASSWDGYEVETSWCRVELEPLGDRDGVLLNGVADPMRLDELAAPLRAFGLRFGLELYDESDALVRELTG
ncbi:hypothetical protein AB0E74_09120 [Streptomyces sp. NPDC030392]|uniref:hypothetical protein n=1 Tax=Streptomyces sp. NPDC030392 TaxID=3155468 RepID=UPI0033FD9730